MVSPILLRFLNALPGCSIYAAVVRVALVAEVTQSPARADRASPVLQILSIGCGTMTVDGEWQFRLGDDLRWAAPGYDDSGWERIRADTTWGAQTHPSYTGFAWYRRHLDIPPSSSVKANLAILMPPVEDEYTLYWNGVEIGHRGTPPPHAD